MKKFTTALLVLPLFAIACSSEPTTTADTVNSARVSQALGEDEQQEAGEVPSQDPPSQDPEVVSVESEEPEHLALNQGDAGAPEPQMEEPPVVGDAGAPVAPEPQPEPSPEPEPQAEPEPVAPPPVCVEGQTRCGWSTDETDVLDESAQSIATCIGGEWVLSTPCAFACSAGACVTCTPGSLFCDSETVRVCSEDAQIRIWVRPEPSFSCDYPVDVMSLPVDQDPPRSIRMRSVAR